MRAGDQSTPGQRAADTIRNGIGSWSFILISSVLLVGWTLGNGRHGFDPYPFILLNLMLSCVAAVQGAILLIAARRADQISAELAQHDLAATMRTEASVHQVLALVQNLHDVRPERGRR